MGFGKPAPPVAQPVIPVPQKDDPASVEAQRKVTIDAQKQDGTSQSLLSGPNGDTSDPNAQRKALTPSSTY
jgi:hypothetical protein